MEPWVSRTMYTNAMPGHSLGSFMSSDDYSAMKEWTIDDAKHWIYSKWQPSNAELIIVGKVDPAAAEKLVRDYFDSWSYAGKEAATPIGYLPGFEQEANAGIYVFDKPLASQTDINLACQLGTTDYATDLASVQIIGDVLSEEVHRKTSRGSRGNLWCQCLCTSMARWGWCTVYELLGSKRCHGLFSDDDA